MMPAAHELTAHPHRRSGQKGQSLVIFSLVAMVLFAIVGLAVDGGFSYFVSDRLERGAVAGALAGVANMPNFNTAPNDATTSAAKAAALNGWSNGGSTNVTVTTAKVWDASTSTYYRNELSVTVAADAPVFFMKLLGFGTHRESRTAIAEYLRPITFGQPGAQIGSELVNLGTNNNPYFVRSEGWGTDRGQGDPYGPNPTDWGGTKFSTPNTDVHALSSNSGTETPGQPLTLPARGGQSFQVYVPPGATGTLQVYNPVFSPDRANTGGNAAGYNYHEDDGDFPESCGTRNSVTLCGPSDVRQWPIMSYTLYKTANQFDHTADTWLSNMQVKSIDATVTPNPAGSPASYAVPWDPVATPLTTYPLASLQAYHNWVNVTTQPAGAQDQAITTTTQSSPAGTAAISGGVISGGASGTTYRLRVDQLDNALFDPGANGRPRDQNSQAHKGYAVRFVGSGCGAPNQCTVTALDDVTLFTPVTSGTFQVPLVSIPPEYQGRSFSLFVFDPGDVACCSNTLSVMRPNGVGSPQQIADASGVYAGGSGEGSSQCGCYTQKVGPGTQNASIQTIDTTQNPNNIYNGKWLRFDINVPSDYATADVSSNPATWFWNLSYTTANPAADTISANLGFTGAPVHIISG